MTYTTDLLAYCHGYHAGISGRLLLLMPYGLTELQAGAWTMGFIEANADQRSASQVKLEREVADAITNSNGERA